MPGKGIFTIQFDVKGKLIFIELDGKRLEDTYNLYENPPPGAFKGYFDLGQMYFYQQPDGRMLPCHKHPDCTIH